VKREILVLEDDRVLNRLLVGHLNTMGHIAHGAASWAEASQYLAAHEPKLVLMDVQLPDSDGMQILPQLVPSQPVIVMTAYGSVQDAVTAMKAGATEYLVKPVRLDELELVVERVLENAALREDHLFVKNRLSRRCDKSMIGSSAALHTVYSLIDAVAPSDMTVLIQGESGTGKELVARAIHDRSPRAERNFVAVDCCTLQENLFESEVFGHEKGAFTGADKQKKGLIEGAEGGTLFLDEIGEIGAATQAKLLRVLETGQFRRVGGTRDLQANVRVVAATNRNLEAMSQKGTFRADLYYRLGAFLIDVPPLRERRKDIPGLVEHFILNHDFSRRINKSVTGTAMKRLIAYDWPGNIRELKNVVERAMILSGERRIIGPEHLAFHGETNAAEIGFALKFDHEPTLSEIEQVYFRLLMERYSGNRAMIAKRMGISERSVYRLVDKYGADDASRDTG
jgi:DNA-binding NtrC family response regulator